MPIYFQVLQKEEQVTLLQSSVTDSKELLDGRDKLIDKLQFDLHNAKEDHRIATDEVRIKVLNGKTQSRIC